MTNNTHERINRLQKAVELIREIDAYFRAAGVDVFRDSHVIAETCRLMSGTGWAMFTQRINDARKLRYGDKARMAGYPSDETQAEVRAEYLDRAEREQRIVNNRMAV